MLGKHKFHVGQRVRPSAYGIERLIFPGKKAKQSGKIVAVGPYNDPTVLWDGRTTKSGYHPDFIAPDRRRKTGK